MASFNIKRFIKNPAKGFKNAGKSLGKAMDNKFVQAAGAAALAMTGVGAPASAAILAGNKLTSTALRGGSVPKALPGIAAEGIQSAMAGEEGGDGMDWLEGIRSNGGVKLPAGVNINSFTGGGSSGSGTADLLRRFPDILNGAPSSTPHSGSGRAPAITVKGKSAPSSTYTDGISSIRKKLGLPPITLGNVAKGVGNAASGAASYAKNNPMDIALLGLAGANAVGAVNATKRANSLSDSALDRTRAEYAARAPMREKGMQGAMNPARPDLTDTFTWQGRPRPISATARIVPPAAPADVRPSVPMPLPPTALLPKYEDRRHQKLLTAGAPPELPDARLSQGGGLKRKRGQMNALLQ